MPPPPALPRGRNLFRRPAAPAARRGERVPTFGGGAARTLFLPTWDGVSAPTYQHQLGLRRMLSDDAVKPALWTKLISVSALDWKMLPAVRGDDRARQVADFNLYNLQRMKGGTRGLTEAVLLPALVGGWSVCEVAWKDAPEPYPPWQGRRCFREVKSRENCWVEEDSFGNARSVVATTANGQERFDPRDGFVIHKHMPLYNRPQSDLAAAYRAYVAKDTIRTLWLIGLEKFGQPFLKGTYPANDWAMKAAIEDALEGARSRIWISLPDGCQIEPMEILGGNHAHYSQALEACDKAIFQSIAGAFLQNIMGSQTGTDPRGNSQVQKSTSELFIWHLAACMADVANDQLLPLATEENFRGAAPPRAMLGGVNDGELTASAQLDEILTRVGLPLSKRDAYERYGRSPPADDADALAPPQPAQPPGGGGGLPFDDGGGAAPPAEEHAEPDPPAGQAPDLTALPGADGVRAEQLLRAARDAGVAELAAIARAAGKRLLRGGGRKALAARELFNAEERQRLAAALAATTATADLLGRSRVRGHQRRARGAKEFAEPFRRFASAIPILAPQAALDYFRRLEPLISTRDAGRFGREMEKQAFQVAAVTEETLLDRLQDLIARRIEEGAGEKIGGKAVDDLLAAAGVTEQNDGYGAMVFRFAAKDSYVTGAWQEFRAPDVADDFPVYEYANPNDDRSRPEHAKKSGKYFSSKTPFAQVRGTGPENEIGCRCDFIPIYRATWEEMVRKGARLSG